MSTDRSRSVRRSSRRYRRTMVATVVALLLATLALGVANALQGPKLKAVDADPAALTEASGRAVILTTNQPLADADASQFTIEPEIPFTVSVDDRSLVIRFDVPLLNAQNYQIIGTGLRGMQTMGVSSISTSFTTPALGLLSLVRDPDVADTVVRHTIGGSESSVALTADTIQEYAELTDAIVAITIDEESGPALILRRGTDDSFFPVPPGTAVDELRSSAADGQFGLVIHDPEGDRLVIYEAAGESAPIAELGAADGVMAVADWRFVPGSGSIITHSLDQTVMLIDPSGAQPPLPLGQHAELRGFIPGTQALVVADPTQGSVIDLANGTTSTLDIRSVPGDPNAFADDLIIRTLDGARSSFVASFTIRDPQSFEITGYRVIAADAERAKTLYDGTNGPAKVDGICISPNGQYLAIEVSDGRMDGGIHPLPGRRNAELLVVDLSAGAEVGTVPGFAPSWC